MPDRRYTKLDGRSLWRLAHTHLMRDNVAATIAETKEALGPWVAQLRDWDIYATFTYDPQKVTWAPNQPPDDIPPPSASASIRHLRAYLEDLTDELGRELGAFCALETTRRGWPHWHALIAAGGLNEAEFMKAWGLWFDTRGFCKFSRVDRQDTSAVAAYCGKYLVKETDEVLLWGRLSGKALPGQMRLPTTLPAYEEEIRW